MHLLEPVKKKKRGQKQVAPTQNPTPITVTVNPVPPSHSSPYHPMTPPVRIVPNPYATHQYYGTPQLSNNPYAFMQYPYTMPGPAAPFYGLYQTPIRAAVSNPLYSSQNEQASSSRANQNSN